MVSATQIARVFAVIQRQTRPRLRCIRFGESPFSSRDFVRWAFRPATDTDLQRLKKILLRRQ